MLKAVTYEPAELTESIRRGWSSLHWRLVRGKKTTYYYLYWDRGQTVIAIVSYGAMKMCQALNPKGIWVKEGPGPTVPGTNIPITGWHPGRFLTHQVPMVARNIHVRPEDLIHCANSMSGGGYGVFGPPSRHLAHPWQVRNQWNDLSRGSFEELKAKIAEDLPQFLQRPMYKSLKRARYERDLSENRFDWEKKYASVRSQLQYAIEREIGDKSFVDNVRVAKVGIRQHYHHYMKQKNRGCCGSHDTIVTVSDGQYHVGFNYGH